MKKYPMLVAEIPFSKGIGGHCTLISDNADGEDGRITNILGIARGHDECKGDTFLSVSRDSIQASSGRNVRDVVVLMNIETSAYRAELLDDFFARLRCFLDQFKELQAEMDQQPIGRARTIVVSSVLRSWLSTMEGLAATPKTTVLRASPPHANATPRKHWQAWIVLALTVVAGLAFSLFLWDRIQSLEPNKQTTVPHTNQPDNSSLPPFGLPPKGDKFKELIGRLQEKRDDLKEDVQIDTQVADFANLILGWRTYLDKREYNEARSELVSFVRKAARIRSTQFERQFKQAVKKRSWVNDLVELKKRYLDDLTYSIIPPLPSDVTSFAKIHQVFECDSDAGRMFFLGLSEECYTSVTRAYYSALVEIALNELENPDLERALSVNGRLFSADEWATILGKEKKANPEDTLIRETKLNQLLPNVAMVLKTPIRLDLRLEIAQETARKALALFMNQPSLSMQHSVEGQSDKSRLDLGDPKLVAEFILDKKRNVYGSTVSLVPPISIYLRIKDVSWRLRRKDISIDVEFKIVDCWKTQNTGEKMAVIAVSEPHNKDAIVVSGQLLADQKALEMVSDLKDRLRKVLVELGGKK